MEGFDYVYILDYSDDTICEIDLSNEQDDDIERIFKKYGLNIDTCSYMYVNHKLDNIIPLEPIKE